MSADAAEFARTLERIAADRDASTENPRPRFDPQVAKDHVDHWVHGKKIEDYHQVLEKSGFVYIPPERLLPWFGETGPQMRTEGEWRNLAMAERMTDMRMAFTSNEICAKFASPEAFWEMYTEAFQQARAAAAGIKLPRKGLVVR